MNHENRENKRRKIGKIIFSESTYCKAPEFKKKNQTNTLPYICTIDNNSSCFFKVDMTPLLFKDLEHSSKSFISMV